MVSPSIAVREPPLPTGKRNQKEITKTQAHTQHLKKYCKLPGRPPNLREPLFVTPPCELPLRIKTPTYMCVPRWRCLCLRGCLSCAFWLSLRPPPPNPPLVGMRLPRLSHLLRCRGGHMSSSHSSMGVIELFFLSSRRSAWMSLRHSSMECARISL